MKRRIILCIGIGLAASALQTTLGQEAKDSIYINEIMVSNIDMYMDPSFNYGAWVEFHNPSSKAVSLGGWYISDDSTNLKKCKLYGLVGTIQPGKFMNVWFGHYDKNQSSSRKQAQMELDPDGGTLYISDNIGVFKFSQEYPPALPRTSFARTVDGGNEWGITAEPTPEESNEGSAFATERLDAPVVSHESCMFTGTFNFSVSIPDGATLYYTTNGATPGPGYGSTSKSGSFSASNTTCYRFRLFKDGMLPSPVVTRSFILKNKDYSFPVLSIVTDSKNLYSSDYGIFAKGKNGRTGRGQTENCNWNQAWDRPANIEFIDPQNNALLNKEVDISACGGWSRAWGKHSSIKLKAQKIYEGENYLEWNAFQEKPYNKNKTIQLRNGGNDSSCRIKDAALQRIVATSGLDIDYLAYQPVHHFINGVYNGMMNLREVSNKAFVYGNYGYDPEEIDLFENSADTGFEMKEGTSEAYDKLCKLAKNAANDDKYEQICQMADIDELCNYLAVEFYLANWDWPQNNLKGWRPRTDDGRFRFILFDLDNSFDNTDVFNQFAGKTSYWVSDLSQNQEVKFVSMVLGLFKNKNFRKQFTDTYCLVAGSVFESKRCKEIITEMAEAVSDDMAFNGDSPWGTANSMISSLNNRQSTMISVLKSYSKLQLGSTSNVKTTIKSNVEGAALSVNGLIIPTGTFSGTLFLPAVLKADAPAGYRFDSWVRADNTKKDLLQLKSQWYYYDQGSLDSQDWMDSDYDDSSWQSGKAPLGYWTDDTDNSRGISTTLDYGGNTGNKRPTYYFRKSVTLSGNPSDGDSFTLNYVADDGFVIYVNGVEAGRNLMPDGTPKYSTYATTWSPGNPDNGSMELSPSLFKDGVNVIAVEVHNNSASSSDIHWDASISMDRIIGDNRKVVSTDPEFTLPTGANYEYIAVFEKADVAEQTAPVRINEICAEGSSYINEWFKRSDWIELYNATDTDIDLAGMYLSNDTLNPQKTLIEELLFEKQSKTVIPAHGFLPVWCDKSEPVSQLHSGFKLDKDGGTLILTAADGSWTDTFVYPAHDRSVSVGLYPDGGNMTYVMHVQTLGKSNVISVLKDSQFDSSVPTVIEETLIDYGHTDAIYDLYGRIVQQPQSGIIYILNGKKVLWP